MLAGYENLGILVVCRRTLSDIRDNEPGVIEDREHKIRKSDVDLQAWKVIFKLKSAGVN